MNKIQRFADARNCIEGKIVAVVLSGLMTLSFLNISVFADRALADEIFDGEVGEPAATAEPARQVDAGTTVKHASSDDAPSRDASGTEPPAGTEDSKNEKDAETAASSDPAVSHERELAAQANDGVLVKAAAVDGALLPMGVTLKAETALTDKVQEAVQAELAADTVIKNAVAYRIALCDGEGQSIPLDTPLAITIENPLKATLGLSAYAIEGDKATLLEADSSVVTDPTSLSYVCKGAPLLIALVLTESAASEDETLDSDSALPDSETPDTNNADTSNQTNVVPGGNTEEPAGSSENGADNEKNTSSDESDAEQAKASDPEPIVMRVGESKQLYCAESHSHQWTVTGNVGTKIELAGINANSVTVRALGACTATVSCGDCSYKVEVLPTADKAEQSQTAYFYFIPAEEGSAAGLDQAQYIGSGRITLPEQYQSQQKLYEGSLCDGKPVSLGSLITAYPTDEEVRAGLAAYYKDVIDNKVKRPNYDPSWTYTYAPYLIEGRKASTGYNGETIESAYHVYVQMALNTSESYMISYQVKAPTITQFATATLSAGDRNVALPAPEGDSATFEIAGTSFDRVLHADDKQYVFDGWYTDTTYRTKAPARYEDGVSTTFYGRYVAEDAPTVTFNANLGTFPDGQKDVKTIRVNENERFWAPEAPSRFGYEFIGWSLGKDAELLKAGESAVMGSASLTYVAQWKAAPAYFVFDPTGGVVKSANGSNDASLTYTGATGGSTGELTLPTAARSGFTFLGWYANPSGEDNAITELPKEFGAGTTTYYAKWEEDPSQRATVTYRASTGGRVCRSDLALTFGEAFYDRDVYAEEGLKNVLGCNVKAVPGYRFVGWFKVDPHGSADDAVPVADEHFSLLLPQVAREKLNSRTLESGLKCYEDTVFEARFARTDGASYDEAAKYQINYFLMDAEGAFGESPTLVVNDELWCAQDSRLSFDKSLPEKYRVVPEKIENVSTGYLSSDYRRNANHEGQVVESVFAPTDNGDAPVVFTVYFDRLMTVKFTTDDRGSIIEGDATVSVDDAGNTTVAHRCWPDETLPAAPQVVAKPGYEFAGWEYEGHGYAGTELSTTEGVAYDRQYTATYTACDATIKFVSQGKELQVMSGKTDEALPEEWPTPARAGYHFDGWFADESCAGEPVEALKVFPAGNTTYYAKWTAESAMILFDSNASDVIGSPTGVKGVTDGEVRGTFPETPSLAREGYQFAGWNTKADGTGEAMKAFPATFAPGTTTYYAQWKLDVRGLTAESFSAKATYNGRGHGIVVPSTLKMKDGETLTLRTSDGRTVANPENFAKNVADSAKNLTVVICDAKGKQLASIEGVSVIIEPAPLTVTTSSVVYPFDGNTATSAGIAVTGLQNGETVGYRATGQAFQVGDEVENGFELTWAADDNDYTATSGNYAVTAKLGTIRVVSSACPVKVEGYVGVYDGTEHAISYEVAADEAEKASIHFDAPTAYTNAGVRTVNYTIECADHGTTTGSIDVNILPRPVTIAVDDSFKIAATADPEFTGAIVEGDLVEPSDLGAISFVRANDTEEIGFYPEVLTARYLRNTNYDVEVIPGTFTIGPAGSTVVTPHNPLLPPRTPTSLGAGMPAGATTPAGAVAGVVTTMVGAQRAQAVADELGSVAGIILDEEVPMAAAVSFDDEEPTVTRIGSEVIEDDATAMGAFDEPHCWVHWAIAIGILLTLGYAAVVVANRLGYARKISDFDDRLTGVVVTEETRAARAAHRA